MACADLSETRTHSISGPAYVNHRLQRIRLWDSYLLRLVEARLQEIDARAADAAIVC